MPDSELLNREERKEKIRKFITHLNSRANEMLWKLERAKRYKPSLLEEFWQQWNQLDVRCSEYLDGKIEWSGDSLQMNFTPTYGFIYPSLEVERDVENFGRNLFCWMVLQTKDL